MRSFQPTRNTGQAIDALCLLGIAWIAASLSGIAVASPAVPTEVQQPGTQPEDAVSAFATNCDNCHSGTDNPPLEPSFGWHGGMMSHAARDPLFWATVAIAEQDFLPDADPSLRGGVGDLCLRCHTPSGWLGGRSTPTDGNALAGNDQRGVECEFCHLLTDPDPPVNVAGTTEEQNPPFEANDGVDGYYGSGQYVINSEGTRLGPYDNAAANHAWKSSPFHRRAELCGTCHDVSNPAVGDLAHNNGAQVPLAPGAHSGVPGSPITGKAAFNNPPYAYGIVERTYSEWKAGAMDDLRVSDFTSLPTDLQTPGGALDLAYHRAFDVNPPSANPNRPDYVDGTPRYYTCQTCHMSSSVGKGCNKNNTPTRFDLPRHDLTGGGYWAPDLVTYQADQGTLRFGTLSTFQRDAMEAGKSRAGAMLRAAARLDAVQSGTELVVKVTNLTGHKLISGYPEGRRMWFQVDWYEGGGQKIYDRDGAYGTIGRTEFPLSAESILDLDNSVIFQAKPGMDAEWADQLLGLGYPGDLPIDYDRESDEVEHTLADLGSELPGESYHSFHFVLNNVLIHDNRIPPFGYSYDEALERSALPVPDSQFGDPGPSGTYEHWSEASFPIPAGAVSADVRLVYQQTSWEYIQFLWLLNDGNGFLGQEGVNLLDAWLGTGMSAPFSMAETTSTVTFSAGAPGEASTPASDQMRVGRDVATGRLEIVYDPACDASDHTIYHGDLNDVSSYDYDDAACLVRATGTASFDPGEGDVFFVVVGNNVIAEGSYGRDSAGNERPEAVGAGIAGDRCDYPQDLGGACTAPRERTGN